MAFRQITSYGRICKYFTIILTFNRKTYEKFIISISSDAGDLDGAACTRQLVANSHTHQQWSNQDRNA